VYEYIRKFGHFIASLCNLVDTPAGPVAPDVTEDDCEWFMYWPYREKVPDGWEMVDDLIPTHHAQHSVILKKVRK